MSILIKRHPNGYSATVTPPEGRDAHWESGPPMQLRKLIDLLQQQGCHQTDIADVLYELNPQWVRELDT